LSFGCITRREFLAALGAAAATARCSRREDQFDPSGRLILDFYTYASQSDIQLYALSLIPQFEATHPHIKVRLSTNLGDAGYDTKLLTLIAGGLAPDVFRVQQLNFPLYAVKDVLLPLDALAAADATFRLDDLYGRVVDGMRYGGQLLGLPSDFSAIVMMYNRDLLQQLRVGLPQMHNWNWDAYLELSRVLTGAPQRYGTANPNAYNRWPAWVWMNGGDIFDAGVTRCTMDSPAAIEGLKFYVDLSVRHRVAAPPGLDLGLNEVEQFIARRVAIYPTSRYMYKVFLQTRPLKFTWDVIPLPRGPAGRYTTFIWGGNCIMRSTRRPKEAWEFVKFLSGPRGAKLMAESGNGLPAHRATAEATVTHSNDPRIPANDRCFLEAIDDARQAPFPARFAEFNTALVGIADTFAGIASVEVACRHFTRQVNRLLERERRA
jgi:multiple sugar transport system substrate-binding protein